MKVNERHWNYLYMRAVHLTHLTSIVHFFTFSIVYFNDIRQLSSVFNPTPSLKMTKILPKPGKWTKMKDLVTVNLTYNEIEIIEIDAFDDLDSLTALYLR